MTYRVVGTSRVVTRIQNRLLALGWQGFLVGVEEACRSARVLAKVLARMQRVQAARAVAVWREAAWQLRNAKRIVKQFLFGTTAGKAWRQWVGTVLEAKRQKVLILNVVRRITRQQQGAALRSWSASAKRYELFQTHGRRVALILAY